MCHLSRLRLLHHTTFNFHHSCLAGCCVCICVDITWHHTSIHLHLTAGIVSWWKSILFFVQNPYVQQNLRALEDNLKDLSQSKNEDNSNLMPLLSHAGKCLFVQFWTLKMKISTYQFLFQSKSFQQFIRSKAGLIIKI